MTGYMGKFKIYCEDGSMNKEILSLKKDYQNIELISFPFENFNRKTIDSKKPSELTADSTFVTADSTILISDTESSDIFNILKKIIGPENNNDIRHVDTAYKERCKIFISPDKKDIISKRDSLEAVTGMKFFYCEDFTQIKKYLDDLIKT